MKTIIASRDFKYKGEEISKGAYFDMDSFVCGIREMVAMVNSGHLTWGEPKNVADEDDTPKRKYTPRAKKDD